MGTSLDDIRKYYQCFDKVDSPQIVMSIGNEILSPQRVKTRLDSLTYPFTLIYRDWPITGTQRGSVALACENGNVLWVVYDLCLRRDNITSLVSGVQNNFLILTRGISENITIDSVRKALLKVH